MTYETYQPAEAVDQQLALLRDTLQQQTYPGYPEAADRLSLQSAFLAGVPITLPDGPWSTAPTEALSDEARQAFQEQGYLIDSHGRPLHPWLLKMLADPLIGVVTGKGHYYEYGPNPTADGLVVKGDYGLLVRRGDTGEWALPGGHLNRGEEAQTAAFREIAEETGLVVPEDASVELFYEGPVADIRATAHAWPETSAFLIRLSSDGPLPEVRGSDDATEAVWVHLDELRNETVRLFGGHTFLAARALGNLNLLDATLELDLSTDEFTELLANAPIYAKTAVVRARPAIPGEVIITCLADGTEETRNTAGENQVVITNPGGEEYLIGVEKFAARYATTDEPGVYRATGKVRAITNPTGRSIEITAPWGEKQIGGPECKIATLYSDNTPDKVGADRYIIAAQEFSETYALEEQE